MDSDSPDELDQRLLQGLQLDGRAHFSDLARQLNVSERTVARRYRRLRGLGLRIVGQPVAARLGMVRWLLRLTCTPDAAGIVADALARRPDTSWVTLASDGTELYCALDTRTADERNALFLQKLPRTPQVLSISAHCMMRIFIGDTSTWHATRFRTPPAPSRWTPAERPTPPRCPWTPPTERCSPNSPATGAPPCPS